MSDAMLQAATRITPKTGRIKTITTATSAGNTDLTADLAAGGILSQASKGRYVTIVATTRTWIHFKQSSSGSITTASDSIPLEAFVPMDVIIDEDFFFLHHIAESVAGTIRMWVSSRNLEEKF